MKAKDRLTVIEKNSFEMGKKENETFNSTGSLKALDGAVRAYRASMQAMRYRIMYNSIKPIK